MWSKEQIDIITTMSKEIPITWLTPEIILIYHKEYEINNMINFHVTELIENCSETIKNIEIEIATFELEIKDPIVVKKLKLIQFNVSELEIYLISRCGISK